eukprot:4351759-Pyramimonas_sp.AAC.1
MTGVTPSLPRAPYNNRFYLLLRLAPWGTMRLEDRAKPANYGIYRSGFSTLHFVVSWWWFGRLASWLPARHDGLA